MVRVENRLSRKIMVKGYDIPAGEYITIPAEYDQSLRNLVKENIVSVVEVDVSDPLIGVPTSEKKTKSPTSTRASRKRN